MGETHGPSSRRARPHLAGAWTRAPRTGRTPDLHSGSSRWSARQDGAGGGSEGKEQRGLGAEGL